MALAPIFPHVHMLTLGPVNIYLIEEGPRLAVVDTGYAGSEGAILEAARTLGRRPEDIGNIVVTHCHPDHAGSLAALRARTGARVWMHRADAEVVRGRAPMVRSTPAPGLLNQVLYRVFVRGAAASVPVAEVDHEVQDGEVLPVGGGLLAVHAPGHSAGHTAFVLGGAGGLLLAADACSNLPALAYSIVYDDIAEGRRSLAKLAALDVGAVCFGHGRPLTGAGVARFRRAWAA